MRKERVEKACMLPRISSAVCPGIDAHPFCSLHWQECVEKPHGVVREDQKSGLLLSPFPAATPQEWEQLSTVDSRPSLAQLRSQGLCFVCSFSLLNSAQHRGEPPWARVQWNDILLLWLPLVLFLIHRYREIVWVSNEFYNELLPFQT